MPRPAPLSGFPELLPAQRVVEQHVLDSLRATFELHGFASVETRAVEPLSVLLRKGEIDKEVYVVRRLHADPDQGPAGAGDEDALALHFDLTVPFARYVVENAGHLAFPFRRYQVQKVWRGERPQEGRYREFVQADIDVVGQDVLAPHHDAEMARVMAAALARLPLPPVRLQVNNRKLIEGFYRGLGVGEGPGAEEDGGAGAVAAVMRAVDKLEKVGRDGVAAQLREAGLSEQQAAACLDLASTTAEDASVADRVAGLGVRHPLLEEGVAELVAVLEGTADLRSDRVRVVADLSVARGLDYYTGTVYETRMSGYESLGSICSGGRYDALASDGRHTYPGVGISLGVTRALAPLLARGALTASRPTPTAVVVAVVDEARRAASDAVAAALRARGVATEVSPSAAKLGRQIRYADRRSIPFVWFPGEDGDHEVKDIRSGEQVPADPATWSPPEQDLRPAVATSW
ncbi:histidine--tRNA ligase [Quadrisphaera sp. DSM 44207]|uniref:histidine--tRNA ligase n=1 Tax=Quadrisphaera sp. DSM 44207 TaxID=1881057 RepID=UPI0008844F07|nr:histidine--tRNA ligase [Quadrisphaera sp. DSM 44207]SDQ47455.1 histidyl-tRNA synthetase [Quadrisphaera sp. DSM 44207]